MWHVFHFIIRHLLRVMWRCCIGILRLRRLYLLILLTRHIIWFIGYSHIEESRSLLLRLLEENNGTLPLGDKSQPEEIYGRLKMSKKAFKKAVGGLFKERLITISDFEIKLAASE